VRVLFWGTPSFAVPALDALLASSHELVGLVTQPDRPRGRSGCPHAPPTKARLLEARPEVPVLQPVKPSGAEFRERLAGLAPDVSVVAAYGNLLPGRVLEVPRLGSLNLHASLLPRHRGAAPVAAALLAGDRLTGVTLMRMDRGLDTGPLLLQRELEIQPGESCGELTDRLARLAADVLIEGLVLAEAGRLRAVPQREELATYAPRVTPEQARIDWGRSAAEIERLLRAYDPWPGAHTSWEGKRLKLFRARPVADAAIHLEVRGIQTAPPGSIALLSAPVESSRATAGPSLFVRTGDGVLEVLELQLEARPRMAASDFLRGRRIPAGSRFS
jgi:methionyl-tRNA formyltransferase